jgi:hypothetical protein
METRPSVRTTGLSELIAALWRRGVPVVGWAESRQGIVLLADGGGSVLIPRARLGERTDLVANALVERLPRRAVLETPVSPELLPQFDQRELAWLLFLRWLRERNRVETTGRAGS